MGFKAAGGVRSAEDAALYYTIVEEILGKEWLTTDLFRIGASSAANNLISAIEGKEVKYFCRPSTGNYMQQSLRRDCCFSYPEGRRTKKYRPFKISGLHDRLHK